MHAYIMSLLRPFGTRYGVQRCLTSSVFNAFAEEHQLDSYVSVTDFIFCKLFSVIKWYRTRLQRHFYKGHIGATCPLYTIVREYYEMKQL